jgi:hypothetical protein
MSEPEPLDEFPASAVEVRGGDRPEDYMPENGCACGPACPDSDEQDDEAE